MEGLEGRQLLAGDVMTYDVEHPHHNTLKGMEADVDRNAVVSPMDALLTINQINSGQGLPAVADGEISPLAYDVNNDGVLSPVDALLVITANNAEAEGDPTAVFTYQFVDSSGAPITSNQVAVGDRFELRTFVRDTRSGFTNPPQGINAVYLDLLYNNGDAFDVSVGEIQQLRFFVDKLGNDPTSSFTLSVGGETTSAIGFFDSGTPRTDEQIATVMQSALEGLPSVGAGNVSVVVDQAAKSEDQANNVPRFSYLIRFLGDLAGQDIPQATLDPTNVAVVGGTFDFEINTVLDGDQSTPAAEAAAVVFADLYDFARRAEVQADRFNDIGATSQQIPLPSPGEAKLVFTIPMVAIAPGVIDFTPADGDNSPTTDIVTGVTIIPPNMVDFGAAFSLTVISDPTAPVANADSVSVDEDTPLTLNGNVTNNDTVTEGRTISIQNVATIPGTTQGTVNGLTYSPPSNFNGTDFITYSVVDSTGLTSNTATVTITVNAVNDPPSAANDSFNVDEDSTNNSLDVLANDNGGPGETSDVLTIVSVGATSNGGTVSIAAGGGSLLYTPAASFVGNETFTYTMEDQGGLSSTATVTVTVEPGVLPRGRTDTASTPENTPVTIDVLANDSVNPNSSAILLTAADGTFGTTTINDNGTPADQSDDTVTYTPTDPDFYGTDTFTYVMNDTSGLGVDSTGTVTVTVTDVNDPPVLANDTASTAEDTELTIAISSLLANDSPGAGEGSGAQTPQTLTITQVTSASAGGSVAIVGNNVVYTPTANFNGTYEFTYTAADDGSPSLSGTATVTVTVTAVNDAPVAGADTQSTDEDNGLSIPVATLLANDSAGPANESGQTLSITGVSATSANGGTVSLAGGTVNYAPADDFNGTDTFTYTLSDGSLTDTGTVTVSVAPINDAPIAVTDSASGFNQVPLVISVADLLSNDSPGPANESAQTLSIASVSATANTNGQVTLNGDGTITYVADAGFSGAASFEYTLQDSGPSGGANRNTSVMPGLVNLNIESFQPSTVTGHVWVDETGDGVFDDAERGLGSVVVMLNGTALGGTVSQSVKTLADGSYSFGNLAPGDYSISYVSPVNFRDGIDTPGSLGDSDSVENQFTFTVGQPGGMVASGYNFGLAGLDPTMARALDQLASRYFIANPSLAYNGAYFAIGEGNNLLWSAKLDGFEMAAFAEAVMTDDGKILLSYVDENGAIFTSQLGRGDFVRSTDASGNTIVRVLGAESDFAFQQVSFQAPPFSAANYLNAIDEIFNQEGWNMP